MFVEGSNMKRRKINIHGRQEDRLSSLPDPILVDILSLIPLNNSITTSTLSRRWQHLWTQITTIHIDIDNPKGPFKYWTSFNKKILPKLTSPLIRRFSLNVDCCGLVKYGLDQIDSWFREISACWKIEEIKVTSQCHEGLFPFPTIFLIQSLVILELDCVLARNLTLPTAINLPKLNKLSIQIDYQQTKQCKFLENLLKSSPSLEDLSLCCCYKIPMALSGSLFPIEIALHGQNLKRLSAWFPGQDPMKFIVIDAPNLEYLKLDSSHDLSSFSFVSTPTMLAEANLSGNPGQEMQKSILFDAISNVRSLCISRRMMVGLKTTKLANMTRLLCTMRCSEEDIKALLAILEQCPVVEDLTLNFTSSGEWERLGCLWFVARTVPESILAYFKRVEMNFISSLMLNNDALNVIKYFLRNARALDRLILKVADSSDPISGAEQCHEVEACKEVFGCARILLSRCQVEFLGRYLRIILSGGECKFIRGRNGHTIHL